MTLIILEGTDYAGKSTLAQRLISTWQDRSTSDCHMTAELLHVGPPSKKSDDMSLATWAAVQTSELTRLIEKHDPKNARHLVVFDRFHWGMPIYGPIYRPDSNQDNYGDLGYHNFMWVESQLAMHGALTVHVMTSIEEMLKRAKSRGDDEYLTENSDLAQELQLRLLWTRYVQFAANVGLFMPTFRKHPYLTGDWSLADQSDGIKELRSHDSLWPFQDFDEFYLYRARKAGKGNVSELLDEAVINLKSRPHNHVEYRFEKVDK
ncbi:thymidylate kinase [Gordonia phage Forza]|uniref:Thymidylate kinase n=1 Tax=Gordonia phage Forza TaxID=2571247 RepID=A0A650F0P6_9CAUD|nr:thymidylate kinase [Gordonia phage Forza]QEM41615.1 thymidylate kinase [Gordonia phage Boopy]QGT55141.1 thymidylate kinase [Gordonia phage Forza]UXE04289.1 thymidylate kinase [Gordonia phage BlueNGold]WBF03930.1 thymidylate kinase [Gordonia phage Mareelih]